MKFRNRRRWLIIRDYILGWTFAFVFLAIVRGVGTEELGGLQFDFISSLMIAATLGPIMGFISGWAQVWSEERVYKRTSIKRFLLLRFIFSVLFVFLLILAAYLVLQLYFGTNLPLRELAFDSGSGAIYFYVISVDLFMAILRQVSLMLGSGNLRKLLNGHFYTPREEERIFMFLDLQSSTEHAEKLGHIQYSRLIQDCFNDLGVVSEDEAEIYQYVGDEVILTWRLKEGIRNQNCLNAYFNFTNRLYEKKDYYLKKYGLEPFFKAGMNSGMVTVTEVGKYKKEIAYHGDPINTAARIQSQCNTFKQLLLVSEGLKKQLDMNGYLFQELGAIPLRGKLQEVAVFAVTK